MFLRSLVGRLGYDTKQKTAVLCTLISLGADVHAKGEEALLTAIRQGNHDLAQFLLAKGADPCVVPVLDLAIRKTDLAMVRLLVKHGASTSDTLEADQLLRAVTCCDVARQRRRVREILGICTGRSGESST